MKGNAVAHEDLAFDAARCLASIDADYYGFTTICNCYPVTLRTAGFLKQSRPASKILLGGPQATAVADETLERYPFIDIVVRGEAELVVPRLLEAFRGERDLRTVAGISLRECGSVRRNPDSEIPLDLNNLPLPAYHLDPRLDDCRSLPLEIGRGCPYACTFCSTSSYFGRKYRLKSPAKVVEQMLEVKRRFGISSFELVHDNYTVDRRHVLAFCEELCRTGKKFTWTCSARPDCLDDSLLKVMKRAGCEGIFLGLEVGTQRMQDVIGKRLNVESARTIVHQTNRRKIGAAVSLICGFPEERPTDLEATVELFIDALRCDYMEPQISLLSPLAGTEINRAHEHNLIFDDVISDMAFQGTSLDSWEREMVAAHPSVFSSFYSVPTPWLERSHLHELRVFLLHGKVLFRWLIVALDQVALGILQAFDLWRKWRSHSSRATVALPVREYYSSPQFKAEFIEFVRSDCIMRFPNAAGALRTLADYYAGFESESAVPNRRGKVVNAIFPHAYPVPSPAIQIADLDIDWRELIRRLRRKGRLDRITVRPCTLVTRTRKGRHEILQMSELSAELLHLCDGRLTLAEIARVFANLHPLIAGIPGEKACVAAIAILRRKGFLSLLEEAPATNLSPSFSRQMS
jgi:radical SAM superfamily enzyme YgiQ (UPF0313 family)